MPEAVLISRLFTASSLIAHIFARQKILPHVVGVQKRFPAGVVLPSRRRPGYDAYLPAQSRLVLRAFHIGQRCYASLVGRLFIVIISFLRHSAISIFTHVMTRTAYFLPSPSHSYAAYFPPLTIDDASAPQCRRKCAVSALMPPPMRATSYETRELPYSRRKRAGCSRIFTLLPCRRGRKDEGFAAMLRGQRHFDDYWPMRLRNVSQQACTA